MFGFVICTAYFSTIFFSHSSFIVLENILEIFEKIVGD